MVKLEKDLLKTLDDDYINRLGTILNGKAVLGIKHDNGQIVFRSGTKITLKDLENKYREGTFKPEQTDIEQVITNDKKDSALIREMIKNYLQKEMKLS